MDEKITAARQKLQAALIAGEQTQGHREALAALEADRRASQAKVESKVEKSEAKQMQAIEKRASALATEAQAHIDEVLSRHPTPEFCQL